MAVQDILQTITAVKMACERYEAALNVMKREASGSAALIPSDSGNWATWGIVKKTAWLYDQLLAQECTSSVPLFDLTTEAATELSRVIRSMQCGQQLRKEHFVAVAPHIPSGSGSGSGSTSRSRMALKCAIERSELAVLSLQRDLASLRSAGRLSDTAYQSAMKQFGIQDTANLIKCKGRTLISLFYYMTGSANKATRDTRSRREQQLEGRRNPATDEGPARATDEGSATDSNLVHNQELGGAVQVTEKQDMAESQALTNDSRTGPAQCTTMTTDQLEDAGGANVAMSGIDLNLPAPEEYVQI